MTSFERLLPPLSYALRGEGLSEAMVLELRTFRAGAIYKALPTTPAEAALRGEDLFLLRVAADMLNCLVEGDAAGALEAASPALELPFVPEPLEGRVYLLAFRLAERVGDERRGRFAAFYEASREHFADAYALLGLGEALLDPHVSALFEGALTPPDAVAIPLSTPALPDGSGPARVGGYLPFANAGHETPTRTYLVQVRKLTDPRIAAFAIHPATLADITDGGDLGREDGRGGHYADLVLDFGDAPDLLRALEPDDLALRLVFGHSGEFEPFAVADGTLFDAEVVPEEGRLYFKLRVPSAWAAAGIPLTAIWPNLESVVLLSHARDL